MELVATLTEQSMATAVEEVQTQPGYAEGGEVCSFFGVIIYVDTCI